MKLKLSPQDTLRVGRLAQTAKENDRLLQLWSVYLNENPRALDTETVTSLARECGIPDEDAFRALFAAACGLDVAGNADDRRMERLYFVPGLRERSPGEYRNDRYVRTVRFPSLSAGKWRFTQSSYLPWEPFVCGHPLVTPEFREIPQLGYFREEFSFPSVSESGVEWMSVKPNEIETMKEPIAAAHGRVLTYGLGLGYFTFHASEKPEVASVTVIERDPDLIALFREHLLPQFPNREKISLIQADAFAFTEQPLCTDAFDFAFVDLWHDQSDGLPMYLRMKRLERRFPGTVFSYWIEPTLLSSLRHMVLDRILDGQPGAEIRTFAEIERMLSDAFLRGLAPDIRQVL